MAVVTTVVVLKTYKRIKKMEKRIKKIEEMLDLLVTGAEGE
jgi:hypothetical protein